MKYECIDLAKTGFFSSLFIDYLSGKPELSEFYQNKPDLDSFGAQIDLKKCFSEEFRSTLHQALENQYQGFEISSAVKDNISSIQNSKTFTVTTGHQLNLFTGPLYFVYKLVSTINLAKKLSEQYPEYHFVPVYWMASEDHDFAEINHFNLFGKKYEWQTDQKGMVGEFKLDDIQTLVNELPEKHEIFTRAYIEQNNLAGAVRYYVNELFGTDGLLVIDGNDHNLKSLFTPLMKDDLTLHSANEQVEATSKKLDCLGYKTQVFPREINLFYVDKGLRSRIVKEEGTYKVLNTDLSFSESEILEMLDKQPEKFSPNVVLRPLYQESILPNVAYIGGPAEVSYWLQLKGMFDYFKTPFPIVMPRNFALVLPAHMSNKLQKLDLEPKLLFKDTHTLLEDFLQEQSDNEIKLSDDKKQLAKVFDGIVEKSKEVDKSLEGMIRAEMAKSMKSIESIEKRLKKSEEKRHEISLNQLQKIKDKLFPDGSLQERKENLLNFYINNPDFISELKSVFDPFNYQFYLILENA